MVATASWNRTRICGIQSGFPLAESVDAFFEREVKPHVPDAWVDESKRDVRDGQVGIVGYEINFNRHFLQAAAPAPAGGDTG